MISPPPPLKSILKKPPTANRQQSSFAAPYPVGQNNASNSLGPPTPQLSHGTHNSSLNSTRPWLPNKQSQQNASTNQSKRISSLRPNVTSQQNASIHQSQPIRPLLPNINPRANLDDLFKTLGNEPSKSNHTANGSSTVNDKIAPIPAVPKFSFIPGVSSSSASTPVVSSSSASTPVVGPSTSSITHSSSVNFKPYQSPLSTLGIASVPESKPKVNTTTRQLCDAESSGGVCRDKNCTHAHFSDFK